MSNVGDCCNSLSGTINTDYSPLSVRDDTLFQIVEYDFSSDGIGVLEESLIYCPFCGTQLREEGAIVQYSPV